MSNKNVKNQAQRDSVEQIREILFGEQVGIIEKQISQVEQNLNNSISQLTKKLDEINTNLNKQIESSNIQLQEEGSNQTQHLTKEIKSLESSLTNKIIETESDLINQIQSGLEKLDQKATHRNELASLLKQMADKLAD